MLVMPSLAAAIAVLLQLPAPLAVGLILVGSCPGGTASNVVTLIARGDVALSVVMTSISTMAAVVLTPRLTELLASQYVPVDGWLLLLRVLQVVLVPVACGVPLRVPVVCGACAGCMFNLREVCASLGAHNVGIPT